MNRNTATLALFSHSTGLVRGNFLSPFSSENQSGQSAAGDRRNWKQLLARYGLSGVTISEAYQAWRSRRCRETNEKTKKALAEQKYITYWKKKLANILGKEGPNPIFDNADEDCVSYLMNDKELVQELFSAMSKFVGIGWCTNLMLNMRKWLETNKNPRVDLLLNNEAFVSGMVYKRPDIFVKLLTEVGTKDFNFKFWATNEEILCACLKGDGRMIHDMDLFNAGVPVGPEKVSRKALFCALSFGALPDHSCKKERTADRDGVDKMGSTFKYQHLHINDKDFNPTISEKKYRRCKLEDHNITEESIADFVNGNYSELQKFFKKPFTPCEFDCESLSVSGMKAPTTNLEAYRRLAAAKPERDEVKTMIVKFWDKNTIFEAIPKLRSLPAEIRCDVSKYLD